MGATLPVQGSSGAVVLDAIRALQTGDVPWDQGRLFALVYEHSDDDLTAKLLEQAYLSSFHLNALGIARVPESGAPGTRDRRDNGRPARRARSVRQPYRRRVGEQFSRAEDRPRLRKDRRAGDRRARSRHAALGAPVPQQGRALSRAQGRPDAGGTGPAGRRRPDAPGDHPQHDPARRVGAVVAARDGGPDR